MDKSYEDLSKIFNHGRGFPGRAPYLGESGKEKLNSLNSQLPK